MPFSFTTPAIPRARPGVRIATLRYEPGVGYQPLESVNVSEIIIREGPEPSKAIFEYITGDREPNYLALGFENVLPIVRLGDPRVVEVDERIVVAGLTPDGELRFFFDGFAQMPEGKFDSNSSALSFVAQGVEFREWDEPLAYSVWRDAKDPTNPTKNVWTGLPVRFNAKVGPLSVANCTQPGWEADSDGGRPFSVFIDPLCRENKVTYKGKEIEIARLWDLAGAVGYILAEGNWTEKYVKLQDVDYLNNILRVIKPKKGKYIDPDDPSTFDAMAIILPDTDVTGDPWPEAAWKLLDPNGYTMCFRLGTKNKEPVTWLDIYKLNDNNASRYKDLYLQQWYDIFDPGASNLGGASFGHDMTNIANVISVDTSPVRNEIGVILAPMWKIEGNDVADAKAGKFNKKHPDFAKNSNKYRLFGADECGEGHYTMESEGPDATKKYTISDISWNEDIFDFHDLFGDDEIGDPNWIVRRRPAFASLWTKGEDKQYLKAELYISVDYKGPMPVLWDGKSGTWYRVTSGFELARDRLGIHVSQENPNAWSIGKMPKNVPTTLGPGEVRTVDWIGASELSKSRYFALLLICMIESDQHLDVVAGRRDVSPTKFEIDRIIDLRDRLRPGLVQPSSWYHPDKGNPNAGPVVVGSVEEDALDYATGKRESRQLGRWAGSATIPRLTDAYIIGDRIRSVQGRFANMQTNIDANGKEAPVYPRVVGITWSFRKGQSTGLNLTDKRGDYSGRLG